MESNPTHILVAYNFYNDDTYLDSNLFWIISDVTTDLENSNKEKLYIFIKDELEEYTSGNCNFETNDLDTLLSGNSIETIYDNGIFISDCNISLIKIDNFEKMIQLNPEMFEYVVCIYFNKKYEIIYRIIHADNTIFFIKDITDNSKYVISEKYTKFKKIDDLVFEKTIMYHKTYLENIENIFLELNG